MRPPRLNGWNTIWVVADILTKLTYLISFGKDTDTQNMARLFIRHLCCRNWSLLRGIYYWKEQFVFELWSCLCERLRIERKLSIAYCLHTDWQIKKINGVIEQYLRDYLYYLQDYWEEKLPVGEFSRNNADSETTGMYPSLANYQYHQQIQVHLSSTMLQQYT